MFKLLKYELKKEINTYLIYTALIFILSHLLYFLFESAGIMEQIGTDTLGITILSGVAIVLVMFIAIYNQFRKLIKILFKDEFYYYFTLPMKNSYIIYTNILKNILLLSYLFCVYLFNFILIRIYIYGLKDVIAQDFDYKMILYFVSSTEIRIINITLFITIIILISKQVFPRTSKMCGIIFTIILYIYSILGNYGFLNGIFNSSNALLNLLGWTLVLLAIVGIIGNVYNKRIEI